MTSLSDKVLADMPGHASLILDLLEVLRRHHLSLGSGMEVMDEFIRLKKVHLNNRREAAAPPFSVPMDALDHTEAAAPASDEDEDEDDDDEFIREEHEDGSVTLTDKYWSLVKDGEVINDKLRPATKEDIANHAPASPKDKTKEIHAHLRKELGEKMYKRMFGLSDEPMSDEDASDIEIYAQNLFRKVLSTWQPISEATPRDREILVRDADKNVWAASWRFRAWHSRDCCDCNQYLPLGPEPVEFCEVPA